MIRLLDWLGLNPWAPPIDLDVEIVEEPPLTVRRQAAELAAVFLGAAILIAAAVVVLA